MVTRRRRKMELCDKGLSDMTFREAADCAWAKATGAFSAVVHSPGSATITDWAVALLCALIIINLLALIVGSLAPRRYP
jgi:hypothetical protein